MQNIAEFHIIGRIGNIAATRAVSHISVAVNYNRRDGDEWKTDPHWSRVTIPGLGQRVTQRAEQGDAVQCGYDRRRFCDPRQS